MEKKLNVGVIGCGVISEIYLRNLCTKFQDILSVRGVFDRSAELAQKRAAQFGLPVCYRSYEEMLADPQIDIVLDLCPPTTHAQINRQAIEAGKHVYCEKPLAVSFGQGRELVELAQKRGVRLGCSPDVPLGALIQTARSLVENGAIGDVVGATANLIKRGVETWHPNPNFLYQPGGGPLLDMGPYYLTALLQIVGPFASVNAMDAISFPTRTITSQPHCGETIEVHVPTYVNALLQFQCGALATFTATFDVWKAKLPYIEIYGSRGTLTVSDPNVFGGRIEIYEAGKDAFAEAPLTFSYQDNDRGLGISDLAQAIVQGREARADGRYALHVLETMDAIASSAKSGQRVTLHTQCGRPEAMNAAGL